MITDIQLNDFTIPSPRDLPEPGIKPGSPALPVDPLPSELPGKPYCPESKDEGAYVPLL